MSRLWFVGLGLHAAGILCLVGSCVALTVHEANVGVLFVVAAAAFFLPGYVVWKIEDKRAKKRIDGLAKAMDSMTLVPADERKYDWLDRGKMRSWAFELGGLGFAQLGDYTVGVAGVVDVQLPGNFTRLMGNCKDSCYAEISQTWPSVGGVKPVTCAVVSIFESGDELRTTNAKSDPAAQRSAAVNIPGVHFQFEPGASAASLLSAHLEKREKLAAENGWIVQQEASVEAYMRQADSNMAKMREHMAGVMARMKSVEP